MILKLKSVDIKYPSFGYAQMCQIRQEWTKKQAQKDNKLKTRCFSHSIAELKITNHSSAVKQKKEEANHIETPQ